MENITQPKIYYHLPGLFEFYDFYEDFLRLFRDKREYFYEWCEIGSIYGAPFDCMWGGGRVGFGDNDPINIANLMMEYGISSRLTFSNSFIAKEHLADKKCNYLCQLFDQDSRIQNGVIIYSDLLLNYLMEKYKNLYFVSSTTKVITDFSGFRDELNREEFKFVVPDFRLNKRLDDLEKLDSAKKEKVEFLCNECCSFYCIDRKACYENVSKKSLGEECEGHICKAKGSAEGYKFSRAMENPGFISLDDIRNVYVPLGFRNFKIEGRSLGSAILLEFLLYYMTKPECQLKVREEIYLDSMLDLY